MKHLFEVINQLCLMETKLSGNEEFNRHFSRCKQSFEEMGITYQLPINEVYKETRTDLEAHITGSESKNLIITQVIKPIIFQNGSLVQRGIVIVEGR